MRAYRFPLLYLLLALSGPLAAEGAVYPSLDFGGLVFGDIYYVPSNHLESGDGATGLVMRRAYLTLDVDFSERWFARVRGEANQDGTFETYEFTSQFKDLYLGVNMGRQQLLAGLTSTPTFDLIEKIWGARYLMRTPMDLQGVASRDTGLSVQGPLNASGSLSYRAMWGAPLDFSNDGNPNSRLMGALNWSPGKHWTLDLYMDTESRENQQDWNTWQVFAGFQNERLRWGVQFSKQDRKDNPSIELASAFIVASLNERSSVIGRIDRLFEPSPRGNGIAYIPFDPSAPATMFVGAYEYDLTQDLTLAPNFIVIDYDRNDAGQRPETDVHLRLTAYFRF
ncbi:MAG: hypothetical protein V2I48_05635 [Xanthomonadales bacterium]|nr:hypothetical protein [Xanthomonadales bacterium]